MPTFNPYVEMTIQINLEDDAVADVDVKYWPPIAPDRTDPGCGDEIEIEEIRVSSLVGDTPVALTETLLAMGFEKKYGELVLQEAAEDYYHNGR